LSKFIENCKKFFAIVKYYLSIVLLELVVFFEKAKSTKSQIEKKGKEGLKKQEAFFSKLDNEKLSWLVALVLILIISILFWPSAIKTRNKAIASMGQVEKQEEVINEKEPVTELKLPVLMYHSVSDTSAGYSILTSEFEKHLSAIFEAGYTPVSADELIDFVHGEGTLPNKPIVITFDDGYETNYINAFPLLARYNAKAIIFVVGSTFGQDYYTDGRIMTSHFNLDQANIMQSSGLVDIQYHTYAMHQIVGRDPAPVREGVLQFKNETDEDYMTALRDDIQLFKNNVKDFHVVSYPYGNYSDLSELIFAEAGVDISFTTKDIQNVIKKGSGSTLHLLGRIDADSITAEQLKQRLLDY